MSQESLNILDRYIEGEELDEQEYAQLSLWITESKENCTAFTELIAVDYYIYDIANAHDIGAFLRDADDDLGPLRSIVSEALSRRQMTEIGDELSRAAENERSERLRLRRMQEHEEPGRGPRVIVIPMPLAWLGIAAVLSLAAIGVWWMLGDGPASPVGHADTAAPEPQAWIVQELDASWSELASPINGDVGLTPGEYMLDAGKVKLRTARGVDIVLVAPVRIAITEENGVRLIEGRLVADVPESAHGFYVDTPVARVVDYGTEFGVSLDDRDAMEVHVYQGEVRSAARVNGALSTQRRQVLADQALRVSDGGSLIREIEFVPERFVRRVAKPLDLADIVAGGDGLGDLADRGIHPGTGGVLLRSYDGLNKAIWQVNRMRDYVRFAGNPLIDGVFVIEEGSAPIVIDSTGTQFELPENAVVGLVKEQAFGPIWAAANGEIPSPFGDVNRYDQPFTPFGQPELNRRVLVMHPNVGLTLSLDALRQEHVGFRPARLRFSLLHAGDMALTPGGNPTGEANLYVLVNGKVIHRAEGFTSRDGVIEVDVPINAVDAGFLTIITTCGSDGSQGDWVLLGEPKIDIEPIERAVPGHP